MKMCDDQYRRPWLTSALRALSEEDARDGASADVEMRLLEEVRALGRARRRRMAVATLAAAAAILVPVILLMWRASPGPSVVEVRTTRATDTHVEVSPAETSMEFLPLIYGNVPTSDGQIVRMEVPRAALASFGLSSVDALGTSLDTVLADVLVGEDGLARGVRFVRRSTPYGLKEKP
jgi:hypothetical protein